MITKDELRDQIKELTEERSILTEERDDLKKERDHLIGELRDSKKWAEELEASLNEPSPTEDSELSLAIAQKVISTLNGLLEQSGHQLNSFAKVQTILTDKITDLEQSVLEQSIEN